MNKLGLSAFLLVFACCLWQCKSEPTKTSAPTQKSTSAKASKDSGKCVEFSKNNLTNLQVHNGTSYALVDGRLMMNKSFAKNGWKPVGTQNFVDFAVGKSNKIYAVKNTEKVNGYLYEYDGKSWKKMKGSGFEQVIADKKGVLYAIKSTKNLRGAIYRMDAKGWTKLINNQFTSMAIDNNNTLYATKNTKNRKGVVYKYAKDSWQAEGSTNFNKIGFGKNNVMVGIKSMKNSQALMMKSGGKWSRKNVRNIQDFNITKSGEVVYIRKSDKGLTLTGKCPLNQI